MFQQWVPYRRLFQTQSFFIFVTIKLLTFKKGKKEEKLKGENPFNDPTYEMERGKRPANVNPPKFIGLGYRDFLRFGNRTSLTSSIIPTALSLVLHFILVSLFK